MADQYNPYAAEWYTQPSRDEYIRDSAGKILGKRCPECGAQVAHPATTRRGTRGLHVVDVVEMGGSPKNPLTMVAPTATTVAIGAMDEMIPLYH